MSVIPHHSDSEQGENQSVFSENVAHTTTTPIPAVTSSLAPSSNPRKMSYRSVVWKDFEKVKIDGLDWAICNICGKKLKANSKNGTAHLHDHLARHKKDIGQSTLGANERMSDGKVECHTDVFNQETSRNDLASMIILHEYPLRIVDHFGFRKFVKGLQPSFTMISRNTIKKDIIKIYDVEKKKTFKLLEKIGSRTAKTTKRGFMAITTHFIDETWTLQCRILRFAYVPIPHNREVISDVLVNAMLDWNIDRKLSTVTLDNATTNDAMMNIISEKLSTSSLLLEGKFLHMRCCAHILNLIVKEGLQVIGNRIGRIRDSVFYWTATQGRIEKFEEAARQLRIPCTKCLELDVKTRWNSTYVMLQTAMMYKDVFPRVKQRERSYTNLPTEEDWDLAKEICGRLKLFNDITELFSGTSYPTANCFFLKICEKKVALSQWLLCPIEVIGMMAFKMMEKYEKYWSACHVIMGIACVLDPRYKMRLVEYYFEKIYGDEASPKIEKIRESCYGLLQEYQSRLKVNENSGVGASSSSYHSGVTNFDVHDTLADFDLYLNMKISDVHAKSELDFYLEEHVVPRTSDFDVLSWWKVNGVKFPTLQKIARDILSIPVSTVASESSFSTSGRLITPHRSRLHPTTLEALMCAQSWLWSEMNGTSSTPNSPYPPKFCDEEEDPDEHLEVC